MAKNFNNNLTSERNFPLDVKFVETRVLPFPQIHHNALANVKVTCKNQANQRALWGLLILC